jgi:hypothetical protein
MRAVNGVGAWLVLALASCAASGGSNHDGFASDAGPGGPDATLGSDSQGPPPSLSDVVVPGDAFGTCGTASFAAQGLPAAMLFVLDASGTMGSDNKYANAQQAIVAAMDEDAFDTMDLGLLLYPQTTPVGAMCPILAELGVQVNCAVTGLPQVPLALAGMNKSSSSSGVRHDMYTALVASAPVAGPGNGNPTYDALENAITTLQNFSLPMPSKRMLFYITDGGASCTSQDTPQRPSYTDGNGCPDWENPSNIVTLLGQAHANASTPVNSLIVGVQGADTTGGAGKPNLPPYSVRLALSAYALAGSPETVPMGCDGTYTQTGTDPAVPCHFDLSTMPNFTMTLSTAIDQIRSKLLGCTFALPTPDGGTVNPNLVNVDYSVGGMNIDIARRANASETCSAAPGCWDYTSGGQVELIGAACTAVEGSASAKVDIVVGCQTVTQ